MRILLLAVLILCSPAPARAVFQTDAGVNGVLTWDGRNKSGRSVASGTYYALIEAAGAKTVRRVVVIR